MKMAELKGTEKQIAWAKKIRESYTHHLERFVSEYELRKSGEKTSDEFHTLYDLNKMFAGFLDESFKERLTKMEKEQKETKKHLEKMSEERRKMNRIATNQRAELIIDTLKGVFEKEENAGWWIDNRLR